MVFGMVVESCWKGCFMFCFGMVVGSLLSGGSMYFVAVEWFWSGCKMVLEWCLEWCLEWLLTCFGMDLEWLLNVC